MKTKITATKQVSHVSKALIASVKAVGITLRARVRGLKTYSISSQFVYLAFGIAMVASRCLGGCLQFVNNSSCSMTVEYEYHIAGDPWDYPDYWYPFKIGYGYGPATTCLNANQTKEATYSCSDPSSKCPFDAVKIVGVLVSNGPALHAENTFYVPAGGGEIIVNVNCDGVVSSVMSTYLSDMDDGVPRPDKNDNSSCGMPRWEVSEPFISLWLKDEPLGYQPALGPRVSFELDYKQREDTAGLNPQYFSAGRKWNFSWLSYISYYDTNLNLLHFPGGGVVGIYSFPWPYPDPLSLAVRTGDEINGYTITYPDGRQDVYNFIVKNGSLFKAAFLSERRHPQGHGTRFVYDTVTNLVVRLRYVIDGDGLTNTISYVTSNAYSTNLISQITDPFGRTNTLSYDNSGHLTNITDVVGISSSITYVGDLPIALTTPYGTNRFSFTDEDSSSSPSGRSVLITEPDGSRQLYLYKDNATNVPSSYSTLPSVSPFQHDFGNYDSMALRNTFHWGPRQYSALSTNNVAFFSGNDFLKARMKHWLRYYGSPVISEVLSMERAPSPDTSGGTQGQMAWYGYYGQQCSDCTGSQYLRMFTALVLPNGTNRFTYSPRNSLGAVTNEVITYSVGGSVLLRTNIMVYAANEIDLLRITNALGTQVVNNVFNAYHQVLTNFNALNEQTIYNYDANQRLQTINRTTGLITTNIYFNSGTDSNRLKSQIDYEIINGGQVPYRTNSYT